MSGFGGERSVRFRALPQVGNPLSALETGKLAWTNVRFYIPLNLSRTADLWVITKTWGPLAFVSIQQHAQPLSIVW